MNQKNKSVQILGWILFLGAVGFFCIQMGYFFVNEKYQIEYIDNRLFYIINILCIICLISALWLLFSITKKWKLIGVSFAVIFIIVNGILLVNSNQQIKNITSISPDFKHVFSIKVDLKSGEAIYYRSYFNILGRPKEKLPYKPDGKYKVEWLARDVAAFTYTATDSSIHQFIGTYGDRGSGTSYYYVGAEMHGKWRGDNVEVISNTEGISVMQNGKTELFDWNQIQQFGTLAIVLMKDDQAAWTIALNENFEMHSDASLPPSGNITLYKATTENNKPFKLRRTEDDTGNY